MVSAQPVPAAVTLCLGGDLMTGRGVDQILPSPSSPRLYESYVTDARDYVALAERVHGPIPRRVAPDYVWGDVPAVLARERPDVVVVNLETAVTLSDDAEPKGINYRMHPANVPVLRAVPIHCCVLANNHVLDWGPGGLRDTLRTLAAAGIPAVGAGLDRAAAEAPVVLERAAARVVVVAVGFPDSGIPPSWAASGRPGVHFLPDFSPDSARRIARIVDRVRRPGDILVASAHWGPNWGYDVAPEHRRFAHALVDAGVDVVYGHSSHHPKAAELYRGRPILYGVGDLLDDYEGIAGYETYRADLVLLWFLSFAAGGRLLRLALAPFRIHRFRLARAGEADRDWLRRRLDTECARFGHRVVAEDDLLLLRDGRS